MGKCSMYTLPKDECTSSQVKMYWGLIKSARCFSATCNTKMFSTIFPLVPRWVMDYFSRLSRRVRPLHELGGYLVYVRHICFPPVFEILYIAPILRMRLLMTFIGNVVPALLLAWVRRTSDAPLVHLLVVWGVHYVVVLQLTYSC